MSNKNPSSAAVLPEENNIMGTAPIPKLLAKFAIPSVISMLVNSIYNLVDQIFIGQGVGYLGNAATNVVFPFVTIAMAVSLMISVGTAANVGLNLGGKGSGVCQSHPWQRPYACPVKRNPPLHFR